MTCDWWVQISLKVCLVVGGGAGKLRKNYYHWLIGWGGVGGGAMWELCNSPRSNTKVVFFFPLVCIIILKNVTEKWHY